MRLLITVFLFFAPGAPAQAIDWHDPHSVVDAALAVSPGLARVDAESRAARERVTEAGSLPNPMLMSGVQNAPIDLSHDTMTMFMAGASQTIPRKAKREAARGRAEIDVRRGG